MRVEGPAAAERIERNLLALHAGPRGRGLAEGPVGEGFGLEDEKEYNL